jgi:membrane protein implicated in regulation of membrane protease activity
LGFSKLIFVALIGLAGWFLYRKFIADATRLTRKAEAKRQEERTGAQGTLVQDPVTGEYKLRRTEDS